MGNNDVDTGDAAGNKSICSINLTTAACATAADGYAVGNNNNDNDSITNGPAFDNVSVDK